MSDIAIRVENLGKRFQIGQGQPHTLRETLTRAMSSPFRALRSAANGDDAVGSDSATAKGTQRSDSIWALRGVSFEIKKGETVGIIGPNGSGKSTLLKILSHITEPTEGEVHINGRVTALIELGAGFHPELTGRENIYLNAAILGLTKRAVDAKFSEIMDFAGLWNFIDTPVKHFSTGMTVRLGFALAVSVEPEILLVDEVLAVGDAAFKGRCLEKIDAFIRGGKTIIIVTHNLPEVERIARRALLLGHGAILSDGSPVDVIARYSRLLTDEKMARKPHRNGTREPMGKPSVEILEVQVCGDDGRERIFFNTHDELQVRIRYFAHCPILNPVFRVQIYRSDGLFCHGTNTSRHRIELGEVHGEGTLDLRYVDLGLLQGDYAVRVAVLSDQYDDLPLHQVVGPRSFHVQSGALDGGGIFAMPTEWRVATSGKNDSGGKGRGID